MSDIGANLERVRERIARAAERSGRRGDDILLIGVSKTVEVERIQQAVAAGVPASAGNGGREGRKRSAGLGRRSRGTSFGNCQRTKGARASRRSASAPSPNGS